ncbi:MAG: sensor histidine kinase [Flavobacteriaceae bacterium]
MNIRTLLNQRLSLRTRLFLSMILLVFVACMLILGATFVQYQAKADDYNRFRLDRKENQIRRQLNFLVNKYQLEQASDSTWARFEDDLIAVTKIHKVEFSLFDLQGDPLFVSFTPLKIIANDYSIDSLLVSRILMKDGARILEESNDEIGKFQSSYSLLKTESGLPYALLFFPYFEDVSFAENELNTFLQRLYQVYLIMLVVAIFFAYFISRYVTRSLDRLRLMIGQTGFLTRNKKIHLVNATREIEGLVNSYNKMIDDLEASAERLAKTEREQAWQEMARQVAHEIKNPLTPMRLTVQSFQRRIDPRDPEFRSKIDAFASMLINQIDTMSQVANAFSDYATLPKAQLQPNDIVALTQRAIAVFEQVEIDFKSTVKSQMVQLDRTQWIRVMTNLVQNGIQSVEADTTPKIKIRINSKKEKVTVTVRDNGQGIAEENKAKIFEPKFTTKSKGMGLGLGIVRNIISSHNGSISYQSKENKGTVFTVKIPL